MNKSQRKRLEKAQEKQTREHHRMATAKQLAESVYVPPAQPKLTAQLARYVSFRGLVK